MNTKNYESTSAGRKSHYLDGHRYEKESGREREVGPVFHDQNKALVEGNRLLCFRCVWI